LVTVVAGHIAGNARFLPGTGTRCADGKTLDRSSTGTRDADGKALDKSGTRRTGAGRNRLRRSSARGPTRAGRELAGQLAAVGPAPGAGYPRFLPSAVARGADGYALDASSSTRIGASRKRLCEACGRPRRVGDNTRDRSRTSRARGGKKRARKGRARVPARTGGEFTGRLATIGPGSEAGYAGLQPGAVAPSAD